MPVLYDRQHADLRPRIKVQERMASAAEQMAANISMASFTKATELKKRLWFTLGALVCSAC
jgi:hypothetical protein